jgi:ankyrin repeat protein
LEGDIVQKEGWRAGEKEGEETQERLGKEGEEDVGKEKGEEEEVEEKSRNESDGLREAERKEEEAQEEAVERTLSFNQLHEQQLEPSLPPFPPASFPPPFPPLGEYSGWAATHTAAEEGDVSPLRSLLQSPPLSLLPSLVAGPGPGGVLPLMLSVRTGHVGVVQMLLQLGKEACRARDEVGRHALLEAWERRDVEMIYVLISCFQEERGGRSWGKDEEEEGREEREGDRRAEKTLPAPSLNDLQWRSGQGLIHDAVREGWREVLKELVAMGRKGRTNIVDMSLRSGGMGVRGWGWTPTQMAAMKDDKEGGRLLWREEAVRERGIDAT